MSDENQLQSQIISEQISGRLHQIFDDIIIVTRKGGMDAQAVEQRFLTRAYAALSLLNLSDANITDAVQSITDGGNDDGIDAIYVSEHHKKIYLVQSKWLSNTRKGIELSEFTRFRDGVKRIINLVWDAKNSDLHIHRPKIEALLKDIDTEIVLVFCHNSENNLSDDIIRSKDEYLEEMNKYGELLSFNQFTLKEARETARSRTRPENINITFMLKNWGVIEKPYKSVYGAVAATEVVTWFEKNRDRLFSENLRFGIEKSEVNDGIRQTANDDPTHFWYFNNGVTAICDDVTKQPVGGNNTDSGVFDVNKISIINGAQTISSLARAKSEGANLDQVFIHLRVISLAGTPENFSTDVTTANNTQNDLSPIDFVAADPNQDRIRREASQIGIVYTYRRGDKDPSTDAGFSVREATIAAACASGELRLAVSAKRYISGLWENTKKYPYTKLFNENTSAEWLWRIVRVSRAVDQALENKIKSLEGRARLVAIHGNRFILFNVFKDWSNDMPETEVMSSISNIVDEKFDNLFRLVEEKFPDSYAGNLFKNNEKQEELYKAMS
ncbi:AIPR family protein [Acetobacter syzygii]|uniref:AIPR family protein n=1 Tax=Acetobacter syzygii TaxID=146476 RepID=UPI0039EA29FF